MITYHEYLQTEMWRYKAEKRRLLDGNKCRICGRPFDLNVHHMTYRNWPNENMTDLITLCQYCHQKIESMKPTKGSDSFLYVASLLLDNFISEYKSKDYSAKGDLNLCDLEVIKKHLYPYLMSKGLDADWSTYGTSAVQKYFRNRRYEKILNIMEAGGEKEDVRRRYKFSEAMLAKVFSHPERAKRLLEIERNEQL